MSIIDFIQVSPHIIGLTSTGSLICWDVSPTNPNSTQFTFLRSKSELNLAHSSPKSLLQTANHICICCKSQIVLIEKQKSQIFSNLQKFVNKNDGKNVKRIKIEHSNRDQEIVCMLSLNNQIYEKEDVMINEGEQEDEQNNSYNLFYATKSGKIFALSQKTGKSVQVCEVFSQSKDLAPSKREKITSMVSFRQDSHLLVATSLGKVLIINLNLKKVVNDMTQNCSLSLEPIKQICLSKGEHKFFTIHENYIVEWSVELQKPLGCYAYPKAACILAVDQIIQSKPSILICGGNSLVQIQRNDGEQTRLETSLLCIHKAKQLRGKIWFGGSNGMIEVFKGGVSEMLLYTN